MAKAADRFQRITMRNDFLFKCALPDFAGFEFCSEKLIQASQKTMKTNLDMVATYHQVLFLGANKLEPFHDPRLREYWMRHQLPENFYVQNNASSQPMVFAQEKTLWELGQRVISYARDVLFLYPKLKAGINETKAWQYVSRNGAESTFHGYTWSLDLFVDYCWKELASLSIVLIALLVVEAIVIQPMCMAYEFFLLKLVQREHMKRFSIILALPSATIRAMASRQLQVDDDSKADEDDDENLEALAGVQVAQGQQMGNGEDVQEKKQQKELKNVRITADPRDEDDGEERTQSRKGTTSRGGKGSRHGTTKKEQLPKTGWHVFTKRVNKAFLGWLQSNLKINGKKFLGNNKFIAFFMLQGLQGPLASLNTMAHVTYRSSRVRLYISMLGMSEDVSECGVLRDNARV